MGARRAQVVMAIALVAASTSLGCGSSSGGGSDRGTSTTLDDTSITPVQEPDDVVSVTSRGSSPRQELRLRLTAGQKHALHVTLRTSAQGAVVGRAFQPYANTISVAATVTVEQVLDDGGARLSMRYDAA